MDDDELEFSNHEGFSNSNLVGELPLRNCSMDSFFDELLRDSHACTHTHTCNRPGPENTHTHTCLHVHTKILPAQSKDKLSTDDTSTFHMLTGVLLSKSFLKEDSAARLFFSTKDYKEIVISLTAVVSYMMFWFLMGVKMDMSLIHTTGRKAITIGISSLFLSTLACSII